MFQPLDGPSKQFSLTVTNTVVKKLQKDTDPYDERKVITYQADGNFYLYFGDTGAAPTAGTVAADGFLVKKGMETIEASCTQLVYVLAVTGSVDIKGAERA